jgi:hypothetical protein
MAAKGLPKKYAKFGFKEGWKKYRSAKAESKKHSPRIVEAIHGKKKIRARKRKTIAEPVQVNIIEGGSSMARKRRIARRRKVVHHRRKSRRLSGIPVLLGSRRRKSTRPRRRAHARRAVLMGFGGSGISGLLMTGAFAVAGAVGASFIASKLPLHEHVDPVTGIPKPNKIKALIPIAVGVGLSMTSFGKSANGEALALGCITAGGLGLLRMMKPGMPLLGGEADLTGVSTSFNGGELEGYEGDGVSAVSGAGIDAVAGDEY